MMTNDNKQKDKKMFKPENQTIKELAFFMRLKAMMMPERLEIEETDYMINLVDKNKATIVTVAESYGYHFYFYSDDFYDYSLSKKDFKKKLYDF